MRGAIARDVGKVLAGNVGSQIAAIARGIAIPMLVTPARYGLWRILLLVWQYGVYLHLGSFALLNRELPGLLAREAHERISAMRQIAFWGTMATSSLAAIGLIALSAMPALAADPQQAWALRISAVGLVAQQGFLYLMVDFRVHKEFGRMSLLGFCQAVAALVFMLPLAYVAGVPGLALGMALAAVLAIAAFARRSAFEPPRFDLRGFARQALRGLPLSSLPLLNTAITSVGQIVAAAVLGLEATGFYGLGVMIGTLVYAIPRALGMVLYPRYLESFELDENQAKIGALLRRSIHVTSILGILTVCGVAIFLDLLYRYAFPSYLPALGSSYALLAMMPFLSYALVLQNALLALRLHRQTIGLQLLFIALSAGLSLAGAFAFDDVVWVALGVMLANTAYGIGALWLALSATRGEARSPLREILAELRPALILGGATVAMVALWRPGDALASRILTAFGQLLVLSPAAVFFGVRLLRARGGKND